MVESLMPPPFAFPLPEPTLFTPVASRHYLGTPPITAQFNGAPPHPVYFPPAFSGPVPQGPLLDYKVQPSTGKRKRAPATTRRVDHAQHPIPHVPELAYWGHNLPGTNAGASQIAFIHEPSSAAAAGNTANADLPVSNKQHVCLFPKRNRHGVEVACLATVTRETYRAHFGTHYKNLGYNAMRATAKRIGKQDIDVPCPWCISERRRSGRTTCKSKELTKHVRDVHFALNQKMCMGCRGQINRSNEPKACWRHEQTQLHKDGLLKYRTKGVVKSQDVV